MIALLLAGDGTILAVSPSRAQLPLLLAQAENVSTVSVGQTNETDTVFPISTVLSGEVIVQVGLTTEDESALALTVLAPVSQFLSIGMISESDQAQAITFVSSGDVFVEIGMVTEGNEAFSISNDQSFLSPVFVDGSISLAPVDEIGLEITPVMVL